MKAGTWYLITLAIIILGSITGNVIFFPLMILSGAIAFNSKD